MFSPRVREGYFVSLCSVHPSGSGLVTSVVTGGVFTINDGLLEGELCKGRLSRVLLGMCDLPLLQAFYHLYTRETRLAKFTWAHGSVSAAFPPVLPSGLMTIRRQPPLGHYGSIRQHTVISTTQNPCAGDERKASVSPGEVARGGQWVQRQPERAERLFHV